MSVLVGVYDVAPSSVSSCLVACPSLLRQDAVEQAQRTASVLLSSLCLTRDQLRSIVSKAPLMLTRRLQDTLPDLVQTLHSVGVPTHAMQEMALRLPSLLLRQPNTTIVPAIRFLAQDMGILGPSLTALLVRWPQARSRRALSCAVRTPQILI